MALLSDKTARKHAPGKRIIRANVRLNKFVVEGLSAACCSLRQPAGSKQRSVNRKAGKLKRALDVQREREEFRGVFYGRSANVSSSTYAETCARRRSFRCVTFRVSIRRRESYTDFMPSYLKSNFQCASSAILFVRQEVNTRINRRICRTETG